MPPLAGGHEPTNVSASGASYLPAPSTHGCNQNSETAGAEIFRAGSERRHQHQACSLRTAAVVSKAALHQNATNVSIWPHQGNATSNPLTRKRPLSDSRPDLDYPNWMATSTGGFWPILLKNTAKCERVAYP